MSTDPPRLLYEHRLTTRAEALRGLIGLLAVMALLAGFGWLVAPSMWHREGRFAAVLVGVILAGVIVGMGVYVAAHWRTPGEFILRVDEQSISWSVPVRLAGRNATIPLADIAEICGHDHDEFGYFIADVHGQRHDIPLNYGVNQRLVVKAIRQVRPDVPVR